MKHRNIHRHQWRSWRGHFYRKPVVSAQRRRTKRLRRMMKRHHTS